MPRRPARALLLPVAGLVLVACGSEGSTSTGLVTESGQRVCVQTGLETAECFLGEQALLETAQVGTCVTVTWEAGSNGRAAEAVGVEPSTEPCPTG